MSGRERVPKLVSSSIGTLLYDLQPTFVTTILHFKWKSPVPQQPALLWHQNLHIANVLYVMGCQKNIFTSNPVIIPSFQGIIWWFCIYCHLLVYRILLPFHNSLRDQQAPCKIWHSIYSLIHNQNENFHVLSTTSMMNTFLSHGLIGLYGFDPIKAMFDITSRVNIQLSVP